MALPDLSRAKTTS